jgi:hypothetical protein
LSCLVNCNIEFMAIFPLMKDLENISSLVFHE